MNETLKWRTPTAVAAVWAIDASFTWCSIAHVFIAQKRQNFNAGRIVPIVPFSVIPHATAMKLLKSVLILI